jgi:hypothetical protein
MSVEPHTLDLGPNFPSLIHNRLGSIIKDSNAIEEEIKERIALGIKAYYANQNA